MKLVIDYNLSGERLKLLTREDNFPHFDKGYFGDKYGLCAFQVRDADDKIIIRFHNAPCYAQLASVVRGHNGASFDLSLYIRVADMYKPAVAFFEFLVKDKRSPFRSLQHLLTLHYDSEGRPNHLNVKVEDSNVTPAMMALAIATRHPSEHPNRTKLFYDLVEQKVDPRSAFLCSFYYSNHDGKIIESKSSSGHCMFGAMNIYPSFKAFFNGELGEARLDHSENIFKGTDQFPSMKGSEIKYTGIFPRLYKALQFSSGSNYYNTVPLDKIVKKLNKEFAQWVK